MDMRTPRKRLAVLAAITVVVLYVLLPPSDGLLSNRFEKQLLAQRRQHVTEAFDHAWHGYATNCMGHDSIQPVSKTCNDDFGGWGATAIDTLSTAIIMGKEETVMQILAYISNVDWNVVKGGTKIQVFEIIIRHFAGMISAHDLLNGPFSHMAKDPMLRRRLYDQMVRLGDILSCAFDTPSGVPRNWLDPALCRTDEGTSNTVAGAGSLILEFARLSDITGNPSYAEKARRAESYLLAPAPSDGEPYAGLLSSFVSVSNGAMVSTKGSWGSLSDSFYEYLLKSYIYDQKTYAPYLDRWKLAADSTIQTIASHPYGRPDEVFLPYWEGQTRFNAMDSLSWFAGGSYILGGTVTRNQTLIDFGLMIANTGGNMYNSTASGLGPEFVHWTSDCGDAWGIGHCDGSDSVRPSDRSFKLRPEVLETWYYAYRATKDPKYREWAWAMFMSIERVCKTEHGYSAISDVTKPDGGEKLDQQESFIFAEVFKYIYLMHLEVGSAVPSTWMSKRES